jgi:hypothetical protein
VSKNTKTKICKTITFSHAVHGHGTWLLTLNRQHRLRVFGNVVLWKIFGPKAEEVTDGWSKLCNFIIGIANSGVIKSWTRGVGDVV